MQKRLIFHLNLSPGDTLVFTRALADLHTAYPGEFITDFRGTAPELFANNPSITPLHDDEGMHINLHYPLIKQSNQLPIHFIQAYHGYLSNGLGMHIPVRSSFPEVYLSEEEQELPFDLAEQKPYWVIVSGGKSDFTNKWPDVGNLRVAIPLAGNLTWVQVGSDDEGHTHPSVGADINLVGKTNTRELLRIINGAAGVVCPNTFIMHIAAAFRKPCVVLAGGREPLSWFQYPNHRVLHTIGSLDCCKDQGCWKSRIFALNDGDEADNSLCDYPNIITGFAQCQSMITPERIARAVRDLAH